MSTKVNAAFKANFYGFRFENTIAEQFYGHTHNDHFQVIYSLTVGQRLLQYNCHYENDDFLSLTPLEMTVRKIKPFIEE